MIVRDLCWHLASRKLKHKQTRNTLINWPEERWRCKYWTNVVWIVVKWSFIVKLRSVLMKKQTFFPCHSVNPCYSILSNFEVMEALKDIKDQRTKFGLRNLATITYEVSLLLTFSSKTRFCISWFIVDASFPGRITMQNSHKRKYYGLFECHKTIQTHKKRMHDVDQWSTVDPFAHSATNWGQRRTTHRRSC